MPQRGVRGCRGSRVAVPLKTGGHRPEKRLFWQVHPQVFFNPAGLFTHTLALPCGVLMWRKLPRLRARGCLVLGLVLNGKSSEVVALLSRCCPRTGQSQRVRSARLMDTAYVGVKPTDGSRSLTSLFSPPKASRVVTSGTRPHLYTVSASLPLVFSPVVDVSWLGHLPDYGAHLVNATFFREGDELDFAPGDEWPGRLNAREAPGSPMRCSQRFSVYL